MSVRYDRRVAPATDDPHAGIGFFSSPTGTLTFQVNAEGTDGNSQAVTWTVVNGFEIGIAETGE